MIRLWRQRLEQHAKEWQEPPETERGCGETVSLPTPGFWICDTDFRLLASTNVREYNSVVLRHLVWQFVTAATEN